VTASTRKVDRKIERQIEAIWRYTRTNKDSLDSERHEKQIAALVCGAVAETYAVLVAAQKEVLALKAERKIARKTIEGLEANQGKLGQEITTLESRYRDLAENVTRLESKHNEGAEWKEK